MTTAARKITALAPWFGSKRTLAPRIVEELGKHRVYWEPFCGSMAVLLAKSSCVMETVNDLHGDLINLARVIQHPQFGPALYRRLRRTMMHETLHVEAAERHRARGYLGDCEPDIKAAYDYFLCAWLGRNGVAGTHSYDQGYCVRYTANGGHAAKRWQSAIGSIPAWRRRLSNVTILCRDAFELIERIDDKAGTAIYVDPPYVKKGAKYIHDFGETEHRRLAEALGRFKSSRIVISYYDHELVRELYDGWECLSVEATKSLVNQGARMRGSELATKAPEVLIVNSKSRRRLF